MVARDGIASGPWNATCKVVHARLLSAWGLDRSTPALRIFPENRMLRYTKYWQRYASSRSSILTPRATVAAEFLIIHRHQKRQGASRIVESSTRPQSSGFGVCCSIQGKPASSNGLGTRLIIFRVDAEAIGCIESFLCRQVPPCERLSDALSGQIACSHQQATTTSYIDHRACIISLRKYQVKEYVYISTCREDIESSGLIPPIHRPSPYECCSIIGKLLAPSYFNRSFYLPGKRSCQTCSIWYRTLLHNARSRKLRMHAMAMGAHRSCPTTHSQNPCANQPPPNHLS